MTIAVQTAVGPMGGKATTELSYSFAGLINAGGFQYGAGPDGLFRLNSGTTDNGTAYSRSFTLATSDYGVKNPKRMRYLYIGFDADASFAVSVKVDDHAWRDYTVTPLKTGLQRIKVPVGRDGQGRYWTVKITSQNKFRIDQIDGLFVVRSTGIRGY